MTNKIKTSKNTKPEYPDYISLNELDNLIKGGADPLDMISQMKKAVMERAMEAELDHHLGNEKHQKTCDGNYRNGYSSKTVNMDNGQLEVKTPRDRDCSFEP